MSQIGQGAGALIAAAGVAFCVWRFVRAPEKYSRLLWLATILGAAIFAAETSYLFYADVPKNDFFSFYLAGKNLGRGLYAQVAAQAAAEAVSQRQYPMPFLRIPFYALLIRPLAWMNYSPAYWTWQALSAAAFIATSLLAMRRYRAAVVAFAWSLPVWIAWGRGQDAAFLLLALVGAVLLLEKDRSFAAGLVLSLCLLKWSLFLPLPIFLFRFRSRQLLSGFGLGSVLILALSFAVAGLRWPLEYAQLLRAPLITPHVPEMPNLTGLLDGIFPKPYTVPVTFVAAVGILAMVWLIVTATTNLWYGMAATSLAGILIPPHSYLYDCALLVPFLVAVAYTTRRTDVRFLVVALLTPVFGLFHNLPGLHLLFPLLLIALLVSMLIESRSSNYHAVQPRSMSEDR